MANQKPSVYRTLCFICPGKKILSCLPINIQSEFTEPLFFVFIVATIILSFMVSSERGKRLKKQEKARKAVLDLKEKGRDAEICSECLGKGSTRVIFWWQPHEANCAKCDGLGYLCELKQEAEESHS